VKSARRFNPVAMREKETRRPTWRREADFRSLSFQAAVLPAVEDGAIVRTIVFFALAIIYGPTPGLSANRN
jgi:hypothetical protein